MLNPQKDDLVMTIGLGEKCTNPAHNTGPGPYASIGPERASKIFRVIRSSETSLVTVQDLDNTVTISLMKCQIKRIL